MTIPKNFDSGRDEIYRVIKELEHGLNPWIDGKMRGYFGGGWKNSDRMKGWKNHNRIEEGDSRLDALAALRAVQEMYKFRWNDGIKYFKEIRLPKQKDISNAIKMRNQFSHYRYAVKARDKYNYIRSVAKILADIGAEDQERNIWRPYDPPPRFAFLEALEIQEESGESNRPLKADPGWTELHEAAAQNDSKKVKQLIESGMDPEVKLNSRWIGMDDLPPQLERLTKKFHYTFEGGETPLLIACFANSFDAASQLVIHGASVKPKYERAPTPLHIVAMTNNLDLANLLIDKANVDGAGIDEWNSEGHSPLHVACWSSSLDVADLFIRHEAYIEGDCNEGTALHIACWCGNLNLAKLLIKHGANTNARAWEDGNTPMHIAAQKNNLEIATLLGDNGADLKAKDESGETPAQRAGRYGSNNVGRFLAKRGAHIFLVS